MKNPDWRREELILALDLYFKLDYGQMHGRNPEVIKLSKELIGLKLHKNIPDHKAFRSVNSVALKLGNFKRLDHNFSGKGMQYGARLDREVWNEFNGHRDKLRKEAELIRQLYLNIQSEQVSLKNIIKPDLNYQKDFIFLIHKHREADPVICKLKKEEALKNVTNLRCEVCSFSGYVFYGELGNDLLEIHYMKEIKSESDINSSEMSDFIIVCSNCHKILDKHLGLLNADDLRHIIKRK